MIYLADAYKEPDHLNFQCEHCDQHHNHFTVNVSVFLYGIAFLTGKDEVYTGFTCPACLKTVLLKDNNPTEVKYSLIGQLGPGGTAVRPDPLYYSSLVLSPKQIKNLQDFKIYIFSSYVS